MAVQNAKDAVEPAADSAPVDDAPARQEPAFEPQAADDDGIFEPAPVTDTATKPEAAAAETATTQASEAPFEKPARSKRQRPSASDALREKSSSNKTLPIAIAAVIALLVVGGGAYFFLSSDDQQAVVQPQTQSEPEETAIASTTPPAADETPAETSETADDPAKNTDRLLDDDDLIAPDARTVTTTTINPQALQPEPSQAEPTQPSIVSGADNATDSATPDAGVAAPSAVPEGNLSAIAPEETSPGTPATDADSNVQRSILYEEGEEAGGAGTAAQGAVVWNIEEETNLDGKSQAVLNASIEIPERDVKVDIRIKPNDDTSLPASHLVEIKYEFPDSFAAGDVVNVPGLVMKPTEEARGDALIGASVKVSPGFFWIALSSLPNEQERNLALLRERGWIDIPMLYENGKRGILTLEKGSAGAAAVEQAISAWQAG
jgi:hypothetical protein